MRAQYKKDAHKLVISIFHVKKIEKQTKQNKTKMLCSSIFLSHLSLFVFSYHFGGIVADAAQSETNPRAVCFEFEVSNSCNFRIFS